MTSDTTAEYYATLRRLQDELTQAQSPAPGRAQPRVTIEQVEAALQRLGQERFGVCRKCFLVIPRGDLLMHPWTDICADCRARERRS